MKITILGTGNAQVTECYNTCYVLSSEDVYKRKELSVYNGIPHLLIPVVSDPKKAAGALNWAVAEMTHRYKLFADYNVRNLAGYNEKAAAMGRDGGENAPEKLPQIVIVVDELADLMMVAPGEVEDAICRLAQLARAAGIHPVSYTHLDVYKRQL